MTDQIQQFELSQEAAQLIRLQRTCYRNKSDDALKREYYRGCMRDFADIIPFLPFVDSIFDIGAGMGGVDVLLFRACPVMAKPHLFLFDLDRVDEKIGYGFTTRPSAYSSLHVTREFLRANGIHEPDFTVTNAFPHGRKFDLTISLISMGFHYPVEPYVDWLDTKTLILDVRKGTKEMSSLKRRFNEVVILHDYGRYERVVCR